jgi:hypothetical protein
LTVPPAILRLGKIGTGPEMTPSYTLIILLSIANCAFSARFGGWVAGNGGKTQIPP